VTAASPQRTSVLAVGLERYDWGNALDLPGAADHAVRFAQWAASRGVPLARIRLACSWLEAPAAKPVPGAVTVGTTCHELETALYALMAEGGDLLLLYWCGHGVTEEGTNRALFTSNAIENVKRNLLLGEIQKLLTSSTGAGFAQVVVVVDACANFLEQLNAERSLPKVTFGELTAREVPLFLYLSTDLGQIAEIDPQLRRATFSTNVIRWLAEAGDGLPPDLDRLRHDVDAVFTERAQAGGFRQRPVSVVVRTVGGSEERVTYSSQPAATHLQHSQRRRLTDAVIASRLLGEGPEPLDVVSVLGAVGAAESRVATAFAKGRGESLVGVLSGFVRVDPARAAAFAEVRATWRRQLRTAPLLQAFARVTREQVLTALHRTLPPGTGCQARDLAAAVEHAAALPPQAPGNIDPLHRMVVMLERLTGTTIADDWFELDDQQLAQLRDAATGWLSAAPAHIVIDLRSGGSPLGVPVLPSLVTAYVRRRIGGALRWDRYDAESGSGEDGRPMLAGVQAAVQEVLDRVYDEGETSFTVGFVVPRALQDQLPETWPLLQDFAPPRSLGLEHPAVLHSGERLAVRAKTQAAWRRRAADVQAAIAAAAPTITWVKDAQRRQPQGVRHAVEAATAAVIGLEFVPGTAPDDLSTDAIIAAIMAGAPYVVWTQGDPEDWAKLCRQVCTLVEQGPFADVARRLHEIRKQQPDTLGAGLRMLWDDPDLLAPVLPLRGAATLDRTGGFGNG